MQMLEKWLPTLASGIDVGQGINVGPGKNPKLINVGPTSIREARLHTLIL